MATHPNFPGVARKEIAQLAAANTNLDGTGTIVDGFTPGASGSIVNRVRIKATGVTTVGQVAIYLKNSAVYYLLKEVLVTAITPAAGTIAFEAEEDWSGKGIVLKSTDILAFSTYNAETFNIEVEGADF